MRRIFCDVCGKEIVGLMPQERVDAMNAVPDNRGVGERHPEDLCLDCFDRASTAFWQALKLKVKGNPCG